MGSDALSSVTGQVTRRLRWPRSGKATDTTPSSGQKPADAGDLACGEDEGRTLEAQSDVAMKPPLADARRTPRGVITCQGARPVRCSLPLKQGGNGVASRLTILTINTKTTSELQK